MKILKSFIAVILLGTVLMACKKDDVTPPFVFEGKWEGKIGNGSSTPSGQYALNIMPGGSLQRLSSSGAVSGTGTWQLAGNSFTATYTLASGTVVNISGTVDKGKYKISGIWNNPSETGTWYVNKKVQ